MKNSALKRFESKFVPVTETGCWIWFGADKGEKAGGHGVFAMNSNLKIGAHRASWIFYRGEIPDGMSVLHKCDVPACVNPSHLFLGTQQDNIADMVKKGRQRGVVGEKHHNTRLASRDVGFMRKLHENGVSRRWLCQIFGLKKSMVWNITSGKNWMQP